MWIQTRDRLLMVALVAGTVLLFAMAIRSVLRDRARARGAEEYSRMQEQAEEPCPRQPRAWWTGDTTGNLVLDVIGSNKGAMYGGAALTQGRKGGYAFRFNGDGAYIYLENPLSRLYAFSLAAWIKAPAEKRLRAIVGYIHPRTRLGYQLQLDEDNRLRCEFLFRQQQQQQQQDLQGAVSSRAPVADDQWHHVACTWNGAELKVFVDGNPQGTPSYSHRPGIASPETMDLAESPRLYAGKDPSPTDGRFFRGIIDELILYDQALTLSEIETVMSSRGQNCAWRYQR